MPRRITPETAIKKQIKDYLRYRGWYVYHNMAGLGSLPGLSDLTAVKDGLVLWIEVKAPRGQVSEFQERFGEAIGRHGGHYLVAYGYEDVERYIADITGEVPDRQETLFGGR
jgi:hypothetical protein